MLISNNDPTARLGGLTFSDEDLIEYNQATDTSTLFFDGGSAFTNSGGGFIISASLLAESVTTTETDQNSDGDVDGSDFLAIQRDDPSQIPQWQAEYGNVASLAAVTVPEPSTLWLILLGIVVVRRRFRASRGH